MESWRVKLYEVFDDQKRDEKPVPIGVITVKGSNVDRVREETKATLAKTGKIGGATLRTIRAISALADEKQTLAVIISKPRQ